MFCPKLSAFKTVLEYRHILFIDIKYNLCVDAVNYRINSVHLNNRCSKQTEQDKFMAGKLQLNPNNLAKFIRGEITSDKFAELDDEGHYTGDNSDLINANVIYKAQVTDFAEAFSKFAEDESFSEEVFLFSWILPLLSGIHRYLGITDYLFPDDSDARESAKNQKMLPCGENYILPVNDNEMISHIIYQISEELHVLLRVRRMTESKEEYDKFDFTFYPHFKCYIDEPDRAFRQMLGEYASRIRNYLDFVASGKDISDYPMTPLQRKSFIHCAVFPDEGKKISARGQLPLLKKLVEEGCRNNDVMALEVKAKASMMKDNPCYKQNYRNAKDCLERLLEILGTDNSYPASTSCAGFAQLLGEIYYNGFLTKGRPQYAEAYRYCYTALSLGKTISMFILAEMYAEGHYVPKNPEITLMFYDNLYEYYKDEFIAGGGELFMDVAFNMARFKESRLPDANSDDYTDCLQEIYNYFLVARLASKNRDKPEDRECVSLIKLKCAEYRERLNLGKEHDERFVRISQMALYNFYLSEISLAKVITFDIDKDYVYTIISGYKEADVPDDGRLVYYQNYGIACILYNIAMITRKTQIKCANLNNESFFIDEITERKNGNGEDEVVLSFKGTDVMLLKDCDALWDLDISQYNCNELSDLSGFKKSILRDVQSFLKDNPEDLK